MTLPLDGSQWYARRGGIVRGPFTNEYMARYILLGRIRLDDELSQDRVSWRSAREYPLPFPRALLEPSCPGDRLRLRDALGMVDERVGQRRVMMSTESWSVRRERRVSDDRRCSSDAEDILGDARLIDFRHQQGDVHNWICQPLRTVLLAMLLMMLVLAYLGLSGR